MSGCVHKVKLSVRSPEKCRLNLSVRRPEKCRLNLSVSRYKDRIVAPDEYSGATVVTPSDSEQVLATKEKLVHDDITVLPAPAPDLRPLTVTENGIYKPDGFDGYSEVMVEDPRKDWYVDESCRLFM